LAYAQKMLENQDQEGEDDKQDEQDDNEDKKDQNQDKKEQETPPKITPQDARQMLEAMLQKEKETQEKVKAAVPPPQKSIKNW